MKPTAYLVNTSRGPIVDEAALFDRLRRRTIGGAGLDVYGHEPLPADPPLRGLENVILTPPAGYDIGQDKRIFHAEALEDIEAFLDGRLIWPLNTLPG